MLNFSPEVVIWWTLRCTFGNGEYSVRIMGLISFLLQLYCKCKQSGA